MAAGQCRSGERTLLHVFADWRRPHARSIVAALTEAGADVNAPFVGRHTETALHRAAPTTMWR